MDNGVICTQLVLRRLKPFFVFLSIALLVSTMAQPVYANQPDNRIQQEGTTYIYLPTVSLNFDSTVPQLLSPTDGLMLNTLIPHLVFDISSQPSTAYGCLAISVSPHPSSCGLMFYIDAQTSRQYNFIMWYNLVPSQLYYWRVGITTTPGDLSQVKWSVEKSFTAGPPGGIILPGPNLISPADNSTYQLYSPGGAVFTWDAVDGALFYIVTTHDTSTNMYSEWGSDTNTLNERYCVNCFSPGKDYEWRVKARNDYAWGMQSVTFHFHSQ